MDEHQIKDFISRFEQGKITKAEWTHEAHLLVGLWYVWHFGLDQAMNLVRNHITTHNEAVGTPNTDQEGYHETITRFWLEVTHDFIAHLQTENLSVVYHSFLNSEKAKSTYPLEFYSHEHLFSIAARKQFVEADLNSKFNSSKSSL